MEFDDLYEAVKDETARRWLWNQLPERTRLTGDTVDYVIDSIRLRYDPIED